MAAEEQLEAIVDAALFVLPTAARDPQALRTVVTDVVHRAARAGTHKDEGFVLATQTSRAQDEEIYLLQELVRWMANTVHQAHHLDPASMAVSWRECMRGFCSSARYSLGAASASARYNLGRAVLREGTPDGQAMATVARIAELEARVRELELAAVCAYEGLAPCLYHHDPECPCGELAAEAFLEEAHPRHQGAGGRARALMPHVRAAKVHVAFPRERGGGIVCGAHWHGGRVSTVPAEVTCQTCRGYLERHPELFAEEPTGGEAA